MKIQFDWKQAFELHQILNHVAHVGAVFLIAVPFIAGWSMPPIVQFALAVLLGFLVKEIFELIKRYRAEEDLHLGDSIVDFAIVAVIGVPVATFLSKTGAIVLGAVLVGGYAFYRFKIYKPKGGPLTAEEAYKGRTSGDGWKT